MLRRGLSPTIRTQGALMRASFKMDEQSQPDALLEEGTFTAVRAEEVLSQTLESLDLSQESPSSNLYSSYFPYMMALYGRHKRFDKVAELYNKFISITRKFDPDGEATPPVEMLSALMHSYHSAGEHDETEKCWYLALEKAKESARKTDADTSQPDWVLHRYRTLLAQHLTIYMNCLQATSRVEEIGPLITSLQEAGFWLSAYNWNKYVQILVQEGRALSAYELCEKELMDGWPGWEQLGSRHHMKRKLHTTWAPKKWEFVRRFPNYETLVYLAGAYLDAQGMPYDRGNQLLNDYERVAPRATEAVIKMPRFKDEIQDRLLNRGQ